MIPNNSRQFEEQQNLQVDAVNIQAVIVAINWQDTEYVQGGPEFLTQKYLLPVQEPVAQI